MKRAIVIWGSILITLVLILGVFFFRQINSENESFDDSEEIQFESTNSQQSETEQNEQEEFYNNLIESSFEEVNCPSNPYKLEGNLYKGPLIDTHIHIAPIPDDFNANYENEIRPVMGGNVKITDYICMMNYENTSKVFAFFPVWEPTLEFLEVVRRTMEKYPDRFVPFIMPPDHDDRADGYPTVNAEILNQMLEVYPDLFKGYGEIGLYERGDHGGPSGSPELPPDSARLMEIYPIVREHQLIVYFHLGEGQKDSFEKILEQNPDINFIWHGDQLIPYENGEISLINVEEILSEHPNVYYGVDQLYGNVWLLKPEVSNEEFIAHFQDHEPLLEKDLATWKEFIERHPDQVLWGTDRGWSSPWSLDPEVAITLNNYSRTFIGRLDPSVQEKFAYKNAEKLID